ncbi:hypothetical protein [Mycobacterium hubeiense]|uniref:hypothetical protein n=1 Tax=Mycobacterium hubeiense TaxID=1867256 RepID=UPI0018ECBB38|nr:hypothetical protein [Mycobacterium sp. QGD 101]
MPMQQDDHLPIGWPGVAHLEHVLAVSELLHGFIIGHTPRRWRGLVVGARFAQVMGRREAGAPIR